MKKATPTAAKWKINTLVGTLVTAPSPIVAANGYSAGACLQIENGVHVGLRLTGLEAATIQRLPVGCRITVKGTWREVGDIVEFHITALKRVHI